VFNEQKLSDVQYCFTNANLGIFYRDCIWGKWCKMRKMYEENNSKFCKNVESGQASFTAISECPNLWYSHQMVTCVDNQWKWSFMATKVLQNSLYYKRNNVNHDTDIHSCSTFSKSQIFTPQIISPCLMQSFWFAQKCCKGYIENSLILHYVFIVELRLWFIDRGWIFYT
jgi:hypothetical protein